MTESDSLNEWNERQMIKDDVKTFINNTLRLTPIKTRGWVLFVQTIKNATPSPVFVA